MGGIIDDRQALDAAPLCRPVEHEIHRPQLIGCLGTLQRVAIRNRNLLSLAPFHLQTRFGIEPIHALVIDDLSRLTQFQIDHPGPVAPMALGECDDPLSQCGIPICCWSIAVSARAHPNHAECPAFAEALFDHVAHQITA